MPPNESNLTATSTPITKAVLKCSAVATSHPNVRTKVCRHFHRHYAELCHRANRQPLSELRQHRKSVLNFHCDRVRLDDWPLILEALAADVGLVGLGVLARKSYIYGL